MSEEREGMCPPGWHRIVCDQLQIDALKAENERLREQTSCTLGVGRGDGKLFVHGDYDSIKAAQAFIFRAEQAEARNRALVEALEKIVASGAWDCRNIARAALTEPTPPQGGQG